LSDQGNDAGRRRTRRNHRSRGARTNARATGHATPQSVEWCLSNPELTAKRFTPFQWMVLELIWGQWSGYRTSEWVATVMGEPPERVREARKAAERIAYELAYVWGPALRKWQTGAKLTHEDRRILDKHRKAKKGRRAVPGRLEPGPSTSPRSTPWSELPPGTRRREGIPESYGDEP
jgi:hypothetical protein